MSVTATVLAFPTPAPKDGGKARILARREKMFRSEVFSAVHFNAVADSLAMGSADPEDTAPCEYVSPDQDYS